MGAWNVLIKKYLPNSSLPKVDFFGHFSQVHPVFAMKSLIKFGLICGKSHRRIERIKRDLLVPGM